MSKESFKAEDIPKVLHVAELLLNYSETYDTKKGSSSGKFGKIFLCLSSLLSMNYCTQFYYVSFGSACKHVGV